MIKTLTASALVATLISTSALGAPANEDHSATSSQDMGQRKAIRGCSVPSPCHDGLLAYQREFDVELAKKSSRKSPWLKDKERRATSPGTALRARDFRPDLAWLDSLKLPDMPFTWNERTVEYLEFYKSDPKGRAIMEGWLRAQGVYKELILNELRAQKMPSALLYLAMIESSYNPHVYSRTGASGLWQFMPAGGDIYGLKQNVWLDERNDPRASTQAAIYFLRDLRERFGSWDLALAAYNAGYGAVIKAIVKYNTNDFWTLLRLENALPWESSQYVSKFFAVAIVGLNREAFDFDALNTRRPAPEAVVHAKPTMPLSTIAAWLGIDVDAIRDLNPELRSDRIPPDENGYELRIPKPLRGRYVSAFQSASQSTDQVVPYKVRHGERFEDIATIHGISTSELRKLNGVTSETEVQGNAILVVPKVAAVDRAKNMKTADENLYTESVPKGPAGSPLMVPVPDPTFRVPGHKQWFYRVVAGDSQYKIAEVFRVDRFRMASWNGLDPEAHLHPRMVLSIWTPADFSPSSHHIKVLDGSRIYLVRSGSQEHIKKTEARTGRARVLHTAHSSESLKTVGAKYGLTSYDVARINDMAPDTVLSPGDKVVVYKVVDPTASDRAAEQQRRIAP